MSRTHLAGIVPVAGLKTDYDIDTPEILIPLWLWQVKLPLQKWKN